MSDVSQIDGNAVRLQRESQGWALSDLATRACLSVKQVRQIEEGGMTAFYSETVKLTAARKIAALLQMSEQQLFGQTSPAAVTVEAEAQEDQLGAESSVQTLGLAKWGGLNSQTSPITRSEALHELAQPPEHVEEDAPAPTHAVSLDGDKPESLSVEDQALVKSDLTLHTPSTEPTPPHLDNCRGNVAFPGALRPPQCDIDNCRCNVALPGALPPPQCDFDYSRGNVALPGALLPIPIGL